MPRTWTGPLAPLALAMMFSLAACSQTTRTRTAVTDPACIAWAQTTYSSRDTDETQRQARANNEARAVYCGE